MQHSTCFHPSVRNFLGSLQGALSLVERCGRRRTLTRILFAIFGKTHYQKFTEREFVLYLINVVFPDPERSTHCRTLAKRLE